MTNIFLQSALIERLDDERAELVQRLKEIDPKTGDEDEAFRLVGRIGQIDQEVEAAAEWVDELPPVVLEVIGRRWLRGLSPFERAIELL